MYSRDIFWESPNLPCSEAFAAYWAKLYSYGHLLVTTGYKWDYTFYKWGYKYLQLVKGHNCITLYKMIFPGPEKNDETPVARSRDGEALYVTKCQN